MTRPEWPQGGVNRERVIAELLAFLKSTAMISRQIAETDAFLKTSPPLGAVSIEAFKAEIAAASPVINSCVQLIGGIQASWVDPNNGEWMQGTFQSFSGFDIDSGEWKFHFSGHTYNGPMRATPERLYEILEGQSTY